MSKQGISPAFYQALMDPETRHSVLKELRAKAAQKEWRNKLKDKKKFRALILRVEMSRNVAGNANGTKVIDERPIFYRAWLRIDEIDDEVLPNPCAFSDISLQQQIISLHKPPAISKHIAAEMAGRLNLRPGMTVMCEYNPGPNKDGNQRNFVFEPETVGILTDREKKEYPCLERRPRLIRGGFARNPRLFTKAPPQDNVKIKQEKIKVTDNKIEIGEKILFATNKSVILEKSYALLTAVANVLKKHPDLKIRIDGHTDDRGEDAYNQTLSEARALAVYNHLISKENVPSTNLSHAGFGETNPVADNSTATGRDQNRRVEFTILKEEEFAGPPSEAEQPFIEEFDWMNPK